MKIVKGYPGLSVWDAKNNCELCNFGTEGFIKTDDEKLVAQLVKQGYPEVKESEIVEEKIESSMESETEDDQKPANESPTEWGEIQKKASSLGIAVKGKDKPTLLKEIEEKVAE